MKKRWHILDCNDPTRVKELSESLNISHPLSAILIQRGIDTFIKAKEFFRPTLETLHDPFLMKDMEKAVSRVITAIAAKEKILIFGDYDVDGTTSVALLYRFLKKIHTEENINYYIPHRYREGYGISRQVIEYANENNYSLIISLDCGIKSTELIGYASTLGIDFIVCDHHLPDEELPPAFAILNAKQKGCLYPYKELCGCGVTFKLVTALSHRLGINEQEYMCLLDLVVTAIGADIVPMTGENRVLAYFGLKQLNSSPCAGISALIKLSTLKNGFDISNVVFIIAPRVNAAGRMDEGSHAVKLFIESDPEKAMAFAEILQDHNTERKDTDSTITEEALAMIAADEVLINRKSTVLFQPHWHKGVVGIVASRIIETYHRPTVILAMGDEVAGGSARSVPGFNLYEAIHSCREHLLGYGGHFAAAGMTISPDKIDAFSKKFEEVVAATIPPELLIPELRIDAEIEFHQITRNFYSILKQMSPYGPENLRPVFITKNVTETGYSKIVKEKHVKLVVRKDGITLSGIGFNLSEKFSLIHPDKALDIVYTIDENEWNGETSLQLKVIDFRLSIA